MTPREHAVALLEFSRWYTNMILNGIPDDQYTFQPSPSDNHVLWCLGHLAGTDAWIAGVVGAQGVSVPETIRQAFGMRTTPAQSGNPPVPEVKRVFESARAGLLAWLRSAPDADLAMNLKEKTGGFASDPIDAMLKIAWHEGYHGGQIGNIRKALGLPPSM